MQLNPEDDHICENSTSPVGSTVYTMDPKAKYLSPAPSVRQPARDPILKASSKRSRPARGKASPPVTARSLPSMFSAATSVPSPPKSTSVTPPHICTSAPLSAARHSPLLVAFHKLRGSKSVGPSQQQDLRSRYKALSKAETKSRSLENGFRIKRDNRLPINPGTKLAVPSRSPLRHTSSPQSMESEGQVCTNSVDAVVPIVSASEAHVDFSVGKGLLPLEEMPKRGSGGSLYMLYHQRSPIPKSSYYTPLEQLREHNSFFTETCWNQPPSNVGMDGADLVSDTQSPVHPLFRHDSESLDVPSCLPTHDATPTLPNRSSVPCGTSFLNDESDYDQYSLKRSISSSENAHEIFSPNLAASTVQTDAMSPYHLSQPTSPLRSDSGEGLQDLRDDYTSETQSKNLDGDFEKLHVQPYGEQYSITSHQPLYRSSGGFEGYSLPEEEQSSVLTLRTFPIATFKSPNGDSLFSQQGSKDLVHSWNDGSEHRIHMTALDELVEDLGYLGEIIN